MEVTERFEITKADDERHVVMGFAYVSKVGDEHAIDHSGEFVKADTLETAAYDFVLNSREGDEFHTAAVKAEMVESFVVTPDKLDVMGLMQKDGIDRVQWWVGFHVTDDDLWAKVKDGTYPAFSIMGTADHISVEVAA